MKYFLFIFFFLHLFVAKAQVSLSVSLTVSGAVSLTGNPFFYNVNFAVSSANEPGKDVVITDTLPKYVDLKDVANSSLISGYTFDTLSRLLTIKLVNPIPAGTSGSLQINCAFKKLVTPNNYVAENKVAIGALNASQNVRSNSALVKASAMPPYQIFKEFVSYNAADKSITWLLYVKYSNMYNCRADIGVELLDDLVLEDPIVGGIVVSISGGGKETFSGSNVISWDYSKEYILNCSLYKSNSRTITVRYPNAAYGSQVLNQALLKGTKADGSAYMIKSLVASKTLDPPIVAFNCNYQHDSWLGKIEQGGFVNYKYGNEGNISLKKVILSILIPPQVELNQPFTLDSALKPRLFYVSNDHPNSKILAISRNLPVLNQGDYVTKFIVEYDSIPPGFAKMARIEFNIFRKDRNGDTVKTSLPTLPQFPCDSIGTCIHFVNTIDYEYDNQKYSTQCSVDMMPRAVGPIIVSAVKRILNPKNFAPQDTITFVLGFSNAGEGLINPTLVDTLAHIFEYVPNSAKATITNVGLPIPSLPVVTNKKDNILIFLLPEDSAYFAGAYVSLEFKVKIKKNAVAGEYINTYLGYADNYPLGTSIAPYNILWAGGTFITINSTTSVIADKGVKGKIDNAYLFYPTNATTINGSEVSYKLRINNTGNTKLKDLVLVDALPYKGDAKGSEFTPFMTSLPASNQSNLATYYSLDSNICINEISPPILPIGCVTPSWTTVLPADLRKIKAIKFLLLDSLKGGDSLNVTWNMSAPSDLKQNQVAYNDFHYQARKADDNSLLLTTSPNKVGIVISNLAQVGQYIWLDRNKNGIQDEDKKEGLNGIVVELWKLGADNKPNTADDMLIADTITADNANGEPGYYRFTTTPDRYFLKFKVDSCLYHNTNALGFITSTFILSPAELKLDMNLGLAKDTVFVSGSTQVCLGASVVLASKLDASYSSPSYLWQKSTDRGVSWNDLAAENQAQLSISKVVPADSALYRILASENGNIQTTCRIASDTIGLKVANTLSKPLYSDTTVCAGEQVILNKTTPPAIGAYYWYKTFVGGSPIDNHFTLSNNINNNSYYLIDSISGGCKSERVLVKINVLPKPNNPFFSAETVCVGEQVVLNKNVPVATGAYYWYKTFVGGNPIANNFTQSLFNNELYYLIDSIVGGCKSERIAVALLVNDCPKDSVLDQTKELFFPNGFSPNEDGISDFYTVFNIPEGQSVSVWFFNRWGDLVYKNENYQNDWDGKCETNLCLGQKLPSGTYFLHAILGNGNKYKTNVTLIR